MARVKGVGPKLFIQPNPTVERVVVRRRIKSGGCHRKVDNSPWARRWRYMLACGWL